MEFFHLADESDSRRDVARLPVTLKWMGFGGRIWWVAPALETLSTISISNCSYSIDPPEPSLYVCLYNDREGR